MNKYDIRFLSFVHNCSSYSRRVVTLTQTLLNSCRYSEKLQVLSRNNILILMLQPEPARYINYIQGVHKVSLQFQKFITKANEKTDEWKLLQTETYVFKFSLPYLIRLYPSRPQMFLVVHSSLYRTLSLSL